MSVGSITPHNAQTILPSETVREAANRMRTHDVGTLVVVDDQGRPVGIVSDRDLVVKALSLEQNPGATRVEAVMTANPTVILSTASVRDAVKLMSEGGFRRLPVVDGSGNLLGVVSFDDVMELLARDMSAVGQLLRSQKNERQY
ncbi:MAG: CBS domain-containing protein [Planctomycetota bacterium]